MTSALRAVRSRKANGLRMTSMDGLFIPPRLPPSRLGRLCPVTPGTLQNGQELGPETCDPFRLLPHLAQHAFRRQPLLLDRLAQEPVKPGRARGPQVWASQRRSRDICMGPIRSLGVRVWAQSCLIKPGGKPSLRINSANKAERLPCLTAFSRTLYLPSAVRGPVDFWTLAR